MSIPEREDSKGHDDFSFDSPEAKLLLAVMEFAVREKDRAYLHSEAFEYHCALLRLNSDWVQERLLKAIGDDR